MAHSDSHHGKQGDWKDSPSNPNKGQPSKTPSHKPNPAHAKGPSQGHNANQPGYNAGNPTHTKNPQPHAKHGRGER